MSAAERKPLRVRIIATGETSTMPYRQAVGLLSLGRAELMAPRRARKAAAPAAPAAPSEPKDTDGSTVEDLIGMSTPDSDSAVQEGDETGNKPSPEAPDNGDTSGD